MEERKSELSKRDMLRDASWHYGNKFREKKYLVQSWKVSCCLTFAFFAVVVFNSSS